MMVYMMVYYGTLFLIPGIAVFLFIMAGSRKIRNKNLSFVLIGLGINILASPMALFIGGWQQILHIVLHLILERIFLYSRNTSFLTTYSFRLVVYSPAKSNSSNEY